MRLTTPSCRLGGTTSARMKRWQLSGSTVGGVIGLPAFGDGPVWCRKRSRWSTPPSHCLPPTTLMEQRQNSPCHCLLNTLGKIAGLDQGSECDPQNLPVRRFQRSLGVHEPDRPDRGADEPPPGMAEHL